ncbi:transcriptional regulator [bacterium]|nr:MAG: transcriptional regulator [bacterium]
MNRRIKALMVLNGLQNKNIAKQLRVTPTWVSLVVCGHRRSDRVRGAIASALNMSVAELWPENNKAA